MINNHIMGAAIRTIRSQIKGDEKEKTVALERLKMLVVMAKEHLMIVEQNILSGILKLVRRPEK